MTREEAIAVFKGFKFLPREMKAVDMAIKALEQEPRRGHWEHGKELGREYQGKTLVDITYEDWHCSNCHCAIEQSSKPKWSYCPSCGADMREVEE